MKISAEEGGWFVATHDGKEVLRALIGRVSKATPGIGGEGHLVITDLAGAGSLEEIGQAAKALKELVGGEPLYLGVRLDNPRFKALVRLYQSLGVEAELMMMRWN